ncbi:helix-turn-helix transcriptional regulator [Paracoccus sp. DMF-8]|uniref:LexA family transcriptional regulator n=1 Tax=Paracoccus sp. DMF-8 TaxID=3019445 RepID=UPI0023E7C020|nr:helix-turn-helix transcriptional regulator [Paracoccus sp. DMF-8]MDF3606528.1 helix-turn-helix transcriptional regulator [Paracoccus sp. DMF-8]
MKRPKSAEAAARLEMMRERIAKRLDQLGKDQFAAAEEAGFDRGYFYELLSGLKGAPRKSNMSRIATVLDCDPRYLLGLIDQPRPDDDDADARQPASLPLSGTIEAAVWSPPSRGGDIGIQVPADIRHLGRNQTARIVRGNTWRDLGITDGMIVISTADVPSRDGDLVVAQRRREGDSGTEVVTTIAEIKRGDLVFFEPDQARIAGVKSDVIGIVVMVVKVF